MMAIITITALAINIALVGAIVKMNIKKFSK